MSPDVKVCSATSASIGKTYVRSAGAISQTSCLKFGPNNSKIVLKPRHGYIPKVLSTLFRAQVITLSALPTSELDQELNLLCPVRALRIYIVGSANFRQSKQDFVRFGGRTKKVSRHEAETVQMDNWRYYASILFCGPTMPHGSKSPLN